jgi:abortive phage resistance protein AbiGi (putative antitoxin)
MPRLQRYVANELSHFVGRGLRAPQQFDLLVSILRSGWLTHAPHSPNVSGNLSVNSSARMSRNEMYAPQVVCFCDIPVEDLHLHTDKYSSFGLSFLKSFVAARGGGPVLCLPPALKFAKCAA